MEERNGIGVEGVIAAGANARRARSLAWAGLPLLCVVFLAAGRTPFPFELTVLVERIAYALPVGLTVVVGAIAAARSGDVERRFWRFLVIANGALFLCEVLLVWWLLFLDPNGPPRVSWPFQALHLIAIVSLTGVLWSMTRLAFAAATARLRYAIDVGGIALIVYVLALAYYIRPVMEPAGATLSHMLAGAVYPVAGALMLAGTVANVAGLKLRAWRSWEKLFVAALAVYIVGMVMWPTWYAGAAETSRTAERGLLDLVQLAGHYVLMMATVYRVTEDQRLVRRPLPPTAHSRNRWGPAAVPLIALTAVGAVVAVALRAGPSGPWPLVFGVAGAILTVMIGARSALLALEHGALFHRSITDPLTGLYNHRFFHDRLAEEVEAAVSLGEPVSLLMLDVDDFATINSLGGRSDGERALVSLAEHLRSAAGDGEVVARIGGDEFAIIVPGVAVPESEVFAQRIVDRVGIDGGGAPRDVTVSVGVAGFPEHAASTDELILLADCALTAAKSRGKDRVAVFEPGRMAAVTGRERTQHLERQVRLSSVRALAAAVDARDSETRDHSRSVSWLAARFGSLAGLDEESTQQLSTAALLHDVGKIGVPDQLLRKKRMLTAEEFKRVAQHAALSEQILSATEMHDILGWVRSHHERWDGTGYPDGLAGEDIPFEARILALCDAFDAMTSGRPYRKALSRDAALLEIDHCMGTQFDPDLADLFIRCVASGEIPLPGAGIAVSRELGDAAAGGAPALAERD